MNEPRTTEIIADEILARMGRRRVNRTKLAKLTGMSGPTLTRRFDGDYPFNLDELDSICAVLGTSFDQLYEGARSRCFARETDFFRLRDGTKQPLDELLAA